MTTHIAKALLKDDVLLLVAESHNVARFISFSPSLELRHFVLRDIPNKRSTHESHPSVAVATPQPSLLRDQADVRPIDQARHAIAALFRASKSGLINVRSFMPERPKGCPLKLGIATVDGAISEISRLSEQGYFTILNESIDIHDGGVSGVVLGGVAEFAPDATPRCVDNPDVASLPVKAAEKILTIVYGFGVRFGFDPTTRVEFSVHPERQGTRHEHIVIWEMSEDSDTPAEPVIDWPHAFSRHIGDKAFGLLVADYLGLIVPRTTVLCRKLKPFTFGTNTGLDRVWLRTAPASNTPGKFTTVRGWHDPFRIMTNDDPENTVVSSVLIQEEVPAKYSGGLSTTSGDKPRIEGRKGFGDRFMLGIEERGDLPETVERALRVLHTKMLALLGSVSAEWVFDGNQPWVVQLHREESPSIDDTIYSGDAVDYDNYDARRGLEELRELIRIRSQDPPGAIKGICLIGDVGITSHFGQLLKDARIPSRRVKAQIGLFE